MTKISAQTSAGIQAKPDEVTTEKKTPTNSETDQNLSTVVSNNKKFSMQMQADMTRLQLQNQFAQKNQPVQQQDENRDINGVSTKTILRKAIEKDETQESVLRRTYDEMAFKAGISNQKGEGQEKSPLEMFIEDRMAANKEANNGEYKIFHDGTNEVFTADEWAKKTEKGSIDMNPTDADIAALKTYKAASDYNDGVRVANDLLEGMKNGDYRALDDVRNRSTNSSFQEGFLNKLGADNFVKLENDLKDDLSYGKVLRDSLSTASQNEPLYSREAESETTFSKEVAKKASVEQLGRLTESKFYPMGTNFLVEAGKKVTTPQVGWKTNIQTTGREGLPTRVVAEFVQPGAGEVLTAISRSPQASLELLQNEDFVKNGLRMSNMGDGKTNSIVADIIRNGTTKEIAAANPQQAEKAVKTISESLKNKDYLSPDTTVNTNNEMIGLTKNSVTPEVAKALADVYVNNTGLFSNAAGRSDDNDIFDVDDSRAFIKTIQPYGAVKDTTGRTLDDKIAMATAVKYTELISQAESTGDLSYYRKAADLRASYIDATNQGTMEEAKNAEARREKISKALGIITELGVFYGGKQVIETEIIIDALGKAGAAIAEGTVKNNNIDDVVTQNRKALENLQAENKVSLVKVYEQAANERMSGAREATIEEKKNAGQFIADLKSYNDSLPAERKILDANGRLISPSKMTGYQKAALQDIFSGSENQARRNLYERMRNAENELRISTEVQIKN